MSAELLRLVTSSEAAEHDDAAAVLEAGVDVAYQPIVHLGSGSVIAYEALARPRHPAIQGPLEFFGALEASGRRLEADHAALEAAASSFQPPLPRVKLFLNASPTTLVNPAFSVTDLLSLAERHGLRPSDLVVEVTESEAVEDLDELSAQVGALRRVGIGLAVDDAGAGHSSFRVITRLRPTYIKLDRELVSHVDSDGARHAFIEALVRFSLRIGSRLIAEGIETENELVTLAGLGVEAGQGYYIAAPATGEFPLPSLSARRMIAAGAQRLRLGAAQITAGELINPVDAVHAGIGVQEAYGRFLADPSLGTLVICEPDGRVTGQVPRRTLERVLASPGAWDRYGQRPLVELAERHPLCVPAQKNITEVGAILAARQSHELTEDAVVTDPHGRLIGVLPVREVLRALAEVRGNGEQALNPVSGLPGGEWADRELERRLEAGQPVSVVVADLDGFREINDAGGYAIGDDVIRSVARCLSGVAGGVDGGAVAHVGGDDFLLIVPPRGYEDLVAAVVRSFEAEVVPAARVELRLRGAEAVAERLAMSMASVDLAGDPPAGHRHLEWARDRLAHLLVMAKGAAGHSLARQVGERTTLSTWMPRPVPNRTINVGLVEPAVVLRAVELIEESWNRAWSTGFVDEGVTFKRDAFPGPPELVARLQGHYGVTLREQVQAALDRGQPTMEVALEGDEWELLELLDRIAVVTKVSYGRRQLPVPPELSLLDRLLQQRARTLVRQDRVVPMSPRDAHGGTLA